MAEKVKCIADEKHNLTYSEWGDLVRLEIEGYNGWDEIDTISVFITPEQAFEMGNKLIEIYKKQTR